MVSIPPRLLDESPSSSPPCTSFKWLHEEPAALKVFDVFMFDCDGVIWNGNTLIKGVAAVLDKLRQLGKRIFFVSNNSTITRHEYLRKMEALGIKGSLDEIYSSSFATALYLSRKDFAESKKKVYVVGESGLKKEIEAVGIECVGGDDHNTVLASPNKFIEVDHSIAAVAVGFDRNINYYKLQYSYLCISTLGAEFVATNCDRTSQSEEQSFCAGGTMVAAIAYSTNKNCTVIGKPMPFLMQLMEQNHNIERSKCVMVGDRLDTDIAFGKNSGIKTILVFSGVTTKEQLMTERVSIPDYISNSVGDFEAML